MIQIYKLIITMFVATFSLGLFATSVGSVDGAYASKAAACEHANESVSKETTRDVNPGNVLANLVSITESDRKKPKSRKGNTRTVQ